MLVSAHRIKIFCSGRRVGDATSAAESLPFPAAFRTAKRLQKSSKLSAGLRSELTLLVPPHQFEKPERVAHRMDAAHLIGIHRGDGHRFDPATFAAGDDQHFGFVVETIRATE